MLGKLFKHEWKGTCKVGCLMLILIVGVTFFGWLAFQTPMWQALSNDSYYSGISTLDILSIVTLMLYVFMLIGTTYGMIIYLGVHFYKTMYTDEGYLTHTLPVTKHKLLVSKILVSGIWYLIVTIGVMVSVFVLMASLVGAMVPDDSWTEVWNAVRDNWDDFLYMMKTELGFDLVRWTIVLIIATLIGPFCAVIILFGAISIGQLFTKHRVLMAIVSYVGITVLSMIISSVVQSVTSMNALTEMVNESVALNSYVNATTLSGIIQNVVMAVILYIVSYLIIDKKLNME